MKIFAVSYEVVSGAEDDYGRELFTNMVFAKKEDAEALAEQENSQQRLVGYWWARYFVQELDLR